MTSTALQQFFGSRKGNISLVFAATIGIAAFGLGVAVDYGRTVGTRSDAQNALDTVALAKAAAPSLSDAELTKVFNRNFSSRGATLASLSTTTATSGVVTASATVSVPMSFSGLVGYNAANVAVTSSANPKMPAKYATVTMKTTSAQGAYDKEIYAITLDKNGTVLTRQLALSYDYTYTGGSSGTKKYTPAIGNTITLNISSYDQFAIEMVIYEDLTYTGKKTGAVTKRSNASNASTFIKTSGSCTDTAGETQKWEDGGDQNFVDFVAVMTCTLVPNSADNLRISG